MTTFRLKYIHEFVDRHGRVRRYFRRPGHKRIRLPGMPGSDEFMEAYRSALAGKTAPKRGVAVERAGRGTVSAVITGYLNSLGFRKLGKTTQRTRRATLERFRREHGEKMIAKLERRHMEAIFAARIDKPEAARNLRKVLRGVMRYCIVQKEIEDDPTFGIELPGSNTGGFYTWTDDDIAIFEKKYPIGSKERLALSLLLYTALRCEDVVLIGPQHIRDGVLYVRPMKTKGTTGVTLAIPVHPELAAVLEATPTEDLTFLTTADGRPFTAFYFSAWFSKARKKAGLPIGSAHGLRKAACRRLAEAGCSATQIMAISGHKTLSEVQRYVEEADRKRMAKSAMEAVITAFPRTKS